MRYLKITYVTCLGLLLLIGLLISCSKTPAGIDLDDESEVIPWELITGKIAYRYTYLGSDNVVRSSEIIIIDGDKRTILSIAKENALTYHELSWSLDGKKMAYSDFNLERRRWQLFELNMISREQKHLYPSEFHCKYPSWSRGGKLAYMEGEYGIWIEGEPFYQQDVNLTAPSWSLHDKYLVASVRDSTSQGALYKISLSDATAKPLVQGKGAYNEEVFYDPVYSPDGRKIAYIKRTDLYGEIWLMNADGSNQIQLTSGHSDMHPEWSPDGQWILFERDSQLFIIGTDGSKLSQITKLASPFHPRFAEWIP